MTRSSLDRLLGGLLVSLVAAAVVGAVPGLYLAGSDLQTQGEFLDGVGTVFGLGIVAMVAVPAAAAVVALRLLRRGRRSARGWALAAGLLGTAAVLPFGFFYQPLLVVLVVPLALVVVAVLELRLPDDATRPTASRPNS